MLIRPFAILFVAATIYPIAQAKDVPAPPPQLMPGLGEVHHPVSTKNRQAQQFFDQGLALVYGFNHDEARKSFQRAAELDPKLAMAWWGVALTLGPNYNLPVDPEREKAGYDAVQRALSLQENVADLDAVTLYAESMMNLHPWKLWLRDGKPNEGTEETVALLESVLQRDPNH